MRFGGRYSRSSSTHVAYNTQANKEREMIKSEQLNEIFTALSKAQGSMDNAVKDSQGHGYKYADLAACIDAVRPHLEANGLAVSQMLGGESNDKRTLVTILSHSSGQYIGSEFVMAEAVLSGGSGKNPAQVLGSAITYMRRYAFAAIVGLAQADDDAASNTPQKKQPQKKQAPSPFETIAAELKKCDSFAKLDQFIATDRYKTFIAKTSAENVAQAEGMVDGRREDLRANSNMEQGQ